MNIDVETNQLWLLVYGEYTIEEDSKIKGFDTYGDFYDYYLVLLKAYRQLKFPGCCETRLVCWIKFDYLYEETKDFDYYGVL